MTVVMNQLANGLRNFTLHADHEQNQLCLQCAWKTCLFSFMFPQRSQAGPQPFTHHPKLSLLLSCSPWPSVALNLLARVYLVAQDHSYQKEFQRYQLEEEHIDLFLNTLPKTLLKPIRGDQMDCKQITNLSEPRILKFPE